MKVLVIGSSGMLGSSIASLEIGGIQFINSTRKGSNEKSGGTLGIDISNEKEVVCRIEEISPDYVINSAAYTDVDGCERYPETAYLSNAIGPKNIAKACQIARSKMIQISTDYVFDGKRGMYTENDEENPIQEYGKSKLQGEIFAREILGTDLCILRTSVVFKRGAHNFVTWIKNSLEMGKEVSIVEDQWICPTSTKYISDTVVEIMELGLDGIMNVSSSSRMSRFEVAGVVARELGLDEELIRPIRMGDLQWSAKRPMDSSLICTKLGKIRKLATFGEMLYSEFGNNLEGQGN